MEGKTDDARSRHGAAESFEASGEAEALRRRLEALDLELERKDDELRLFRDRLTGAMLAGRLAWWQMDLRTGGVVFSENKALMIGRRPEDFRHYEDFTALVHPDDLEPAMDAMRRCVSEGSDYIVDYRIRASSGEYRWFHDHGTVTSRSPEGAALVVSGVVSDITEQRKDRQALEEQERQLRLLFDFIPSGLTIADGSGRIVSANKAAERLLGLSPEEQARRSIDGSEWRIIRRDGSPMPPEEYASVRALAEGRLVENVELGLVKPDGSATWLLTSATPTGIPGLDLAIAYQDITPILAKESELHLAERKLRLYLDNIPQPVFVTGPDGLIEEVNDAFAELYGYGRAEAVGATPRILNAGREAYRDLGYTDAEYDALFARLWRDIGDPAKGGWQGELVNRTRDGDLVWVELVIRTLFDERGRPERHIALPIDISGHKHLEKAGRIELYRTIARLSELRDNETGNHMRRVGIFARLIAKSLALPERYCLDLEVFAPMHDIGKVGIPDSVLLAPRGLRPEELAIMRQHTRLGHAIVEGKKELAMAADIIIGHHEKWDGSGYPEGLRGEAIPLAARIVALADVYDALRSERPYKRP